MCLRCAINSLLNDAKTILQVQTSSRNNKKIPVYNFKKKLYSVSWFHSLYRSNFLRNQFTGLIYWFKAGNKASDLFRGGGISYLGVGGYLI